MIQITKHGLILTLFKQNQINLSEEVDNYGAKDF